MISWDRDGFNIWKVSTADSEEKSFQLQRKLQLIIPSHDKSGNEEFSRKISNPCLLLNFQKMKKKTVLNEENENEKLKSV